jgi:A/G-specific adenine glycosylase
MPWKGISDPYKIWLSEIILQQTRVEQGLNYYEKFVALYPSIHHLAKVPQQELFSMWQGLGYYNRCRNMQASALYISQELNGEFPSTYENIRQLKGVGDYTAAAIASFAFKLPYAVVDGNVVRVLSRLFKMETSFHSAIGKKEFQKLAQKILDKKNPDLHNQAIMDLGATVCKPRQPLCALCPLIEYCKSHADDCVTMYPIKKQKAEIKERFFHFLVLENDDDFYISKRQATDIWQDLHTFFLIEKAGNLLVQDLPKGLHIKILPAPILIKQQLTHQKIYGLFYVFKRVQPKKIETLNMFKIAKSNIHQFGFPRIMISFFEKFNYL